MVKSSHFVAVVTLSMNDKITFLENLKQGFERTGPSDKYNLKITTQPKPNTLDFVIDTTFRNVNGFFVLSFKN